MSDHTMLIPVTRGTGTGPTLLAAFDAALLDAGVEQYNLISLSSVIPPGATVRRQQFRACEAEYGYRLYVVMAHKEVDEPNTEAWAGVGWVQSEEDGRGLFVECSGSSEEAVRSDISATLNAMVSSRGRQYGPIECEVAGATCRDTPVCAMVVAVYASAGWDLSAHDASRMDVQAHAQLLTEEGVKNGPV